jgi:YfiH family protein
MPHGHAREHADFPARRQGDDNAGCGREPRPPMTLPAPDPAFHWSVEPWGHALRCRPLAAIAQHAFTTRQLRLRDPEHQQLAWTQATASVGAGVDQLMRIKQVHGRRVRVIRRGEVGPMDVQERPESDAIVSNHGDLVLVVQTADCVPILVADRATGAAAAVHAGWRGTAARVAAAAVDALAAEFGAKPGDLMVAIGPSIGPCCYEVGADLIDAFRDGGATAEELARWFTPAASGKTRLDLWTATVDQLRGAGVHESRIHLAGLCTQTYAEIFESYRVDGAAAGRMAALIRVP